MKHILIIALLPLIIFSHAAFAKPKIVASFSIIGDMTHEVGGDNIEIKTLVGAHGDAHEYEPTPADAKAIASADLVLINGLGFEGWMERLIKSSGYKGKVVTVSNNITKIDGDPHAWQDIANGKIYVENIKNALSEIDTEHAKQYGDNASSYTKKLYELNGWVKSELAKIPEQKRHVISTHDAFQYFAKAYSVNFIAAQGISTESQASAGDIAKLIDQIRSKKIKLVFLENITDSRMMKQLEKDAGARIGGTLYSDSLSNENEPAATYIAMFRHNVKELVKAMEM